MSNSANTFGNHFCFTSFGESHGAAIGGVIDGCPVGVRIDEDAIRLALAQRSQAAVRLDDGSLLPLPGGSARAAAEPDEIEWLSGLHNGVTLGTPIAFIIRNQQHRSADYDVLTDVFRPGHADYTYYQKYGVRDARGGGRASARETVSRIVAGCIARQLLAGKGISIQANLVQVGQTTDPVLFADEITYAQTNGDSVGGVVACLVKGVPAGVGEPIFDKLQARLAYAMLSIPACKGFEYGHGFASATMRGSAANTFSGGILGGITDGTDISFRCAFKPTPSIAAPQMAQTMNGDLREITIHGRHDACVAARAASVVEAMTALTLADYLI